MLGYVYHIYIHSFLLLSALMSFPGHSVHDEERPGVLNLRAACTPQPFLVQLCHLRPENPPCDLLFLAGRTAATSNFS